MEPESDGYKQLDYLLWYLMWCPFEQLGNWLDAAGLPPNASFVTLTIDNLRKILFQLDLMFDRLADIKCITPEEAASLKKKTADAREAASRSAEGSLGATSRSKGSADLNSHLRSVRDELVNIRGREACQKLEPEFFPPPLR